MSSITNLNPVMVQPAMAESDVHQWRRDFPILHQTINDRPLVYLDNAATTQKPQVVIDTLSRYYAETNSNIHRGVHSLSQRATEAYEQARDTVRGFINAARREEIIFVKGTTEAINLVAQSYGRSRLQAGDEILISHMEHHSNIVPWQLLCEQLGTVLKVLPINTDGELCMDKLDSLLGPKTRLVALVHASNALGTINPVKTIIDRAHAKDIPVLLDGAQAVAHMSVDVQALDCDFYAFSGHKLFAPTGVGVLYGKAERLEAMPPYQGGGDMIRMVSFDKTLYNDLPYKFEAGTPNIAGVIGLGAALEYLNGIEFSDACEHEDRLLAYATDRLTALPKARVIGTAREKTGILSFTIDGIHPHDLGTILDHHGVAIRTGHHCAMPVMEFFQVPATARASFAFYNTHEEVDRLIAALEHAQKVMG